MRVALPPNNLRRDSARRLVLFVALLLFAGGSVDSESASLNSETAFESFRIVIERNIFDPNRRPAGRRERPDFETVRSEPIQTDQFFLIGVLIYGGTEVTFFEGSQPEFDAPFELGDAIAGYRLVEIRTESVKLEKDGQRIVLPVGSGMRRQNGDRWEIVTERVSASDRPRFGSRRRTQSEPDADSKPGPAKTESGNASGSDLLQQLMKRRKQELEQ